MHTFTINILGQYLTSTKVFETEEMANDALNEYLELTRDNFPKVKIIGYVHMA